MLSRLTVSLHERENPTGAGRGLSLIANAMIFEYVILNGFRRYSHSMTV